MTDPAKVSILKLMGKVLGASSSRARAGTGGA